MRALQSLGVEPGADLLSPIPDQNPKGFFEDEPLLQISDQVLQTLDLSWDSPRIIHSGAWQLKAVAELELEAVNSIRSRFAATRDWGFKNPRTARLLPFWQRVFERCGREAAYLIVVRNPLSVAQSLHVRNGMTAQRANLLWLIHMTEAVVHTRGAKRICLDYDALVAAPGDQLVRVAAGLGLTRPTSDDSRLKEFVEDFLSPELRKTRYEAPDLELDPAVSELCRTAHSVLALWSQDDPKISSSKLQRTFNQIHRDLVKLAPTLDDLATTDCNLRQAHASLEGERAGLAQLRASSEALSRDLAGTRDELTHRTLEFEAERARAQHLEAHSQARTEELGRIHAFAAEIEARLESRDQELMRANDRLEAVRGKLDTQAGLLSEMRDEVSRVEAHARTRSEKAQDLGRVVKTQTVEIARLRSGQLRLEESHRKELTDVAGERRSERAELETRLSALSSRIVEIEADRVHEQRIAQELSREKAARDADVERLRHQRDREEEAANSWLREQATFLTGDLVEKIEAISQTRQWAMTRSLQRGVSRLRRRAWVDGLAHLERLAKTLHAESQRGVPDVRFLAALTADLGKTLQAISGGEIFRFSRNLTALRFAIRLSARPDGPFEFVRNRIGELQFFFENLGSAPTVVDPSPGLDERAEIGGIVDVVIPVYGARAATLRCIQSVLDSRNRTPSEIIVIDDESRDAALSRALEAWATAGRLTLLRNDRNLGFPATANRGMSLHNDRDVVLLNSDTMVHGDWLDRLRRSAHRDWMIATATPFSNNAEICSYPVPCRADPMPSPERLAELDAIAARVNRSLDATIPTAVGFCMYIRRDAIREVGFFDAERFGLGYGEENDFCLRARARGYRHVLAADVFVAHEGGVSFSTAKQELIENGLAELDRTHPGYRAEIQSFISRDSVRWLRQRLDADKLTRDGRPTILMISHSKGGGTHRHVLELASAVEQEGVNVLLLQPSNPGRVTLSRPETPATKSLEFSLPEDFDVLIEILRESGVRHVHVHHLLGVDRIVVEIAAALRCAYDATLHDYLAICPRVHVTDDRNRYCELPAVSVCNACVKQNGSEAGFEVDVGQWRRDQHAWLSGARRVFVPSEDARKRLATRMPDVEFFVRPHAEDYSDTRKLARRGRRRGPRRVAVIGAIGPHKGSAILYACALDAAARKLTLEFLLIGFSDRDQDLLETKKVQITGRYEESQLESLLRRARCEIAFIPSVWPETFCYTLSAAFKWQLYPVAFNLGAIAERVEALGWGDLIALDSRPEEVNDHLLALELRDLPSEHTVETLGVHYPNYLIDYYGGILSDTDPVERRSI